MTQGLYFSGPRPELVTLGRPRVDLVSSAVWKGIERLIPRSLLPTTWEIEGTIAHDLCAEAREEMAVDSRAFDRTRLFAVLKEYLPVARRLTLSWEDEAVACLSTRAEDDFLSSVADQLRSDRTWAVNAIYTR